MPTPAPEITATSPIPATTARRARPTNGAEEPTGVGATALDRIGPEAPEAGNRTPSEGPAAEPARHGPLLRLEHIDAGAIDDCGSRIARICFRGKHFAIYLSAHDDWGDEIRVKYSDDDEVRKIQFKNVSAISDRRYALDQLARGLRTRCYYLGQIAAAIRLVVEDSVADHDQAAGVLDRAISDVREERARIGRRIYLIFALLFSGGAAAMLLLGAWLLAPANDALAVLPAAAGSGAIGALLSIAIALRGRAVAPDHDYWTNCTDALLRVTVGTLSGGALILFLTAGLVLDFTIGDAKMVGAGLTESWRAILTFGFLGGFTERMVPDLLERTAAPGQNDPETSRADSIAGRAGAAAPG